MNNISLACKGRAWKASKVRKKMVKFSDQNCLVYHCTFIINPVNANQVQLKWPCIRNVQEKAKEKGGKREKKEEKWGIKSQRTKQNKKTKKKQQKHLHAHTFSHHDPYAMSFHECKILAVLDCKE